MRALVVGQADCGAVTASVEEVARGRPAGRRGEGRGRAVNRQRQGWALHDRAGRPGAPLYPHAQGVDFAGHVIDSRDPRVRPGDGVILTGWRVGEVAWDGYAEEARVKADRLGPLPKDLSTRATKVIGTAGLTAMLALQALEDHGQTHGAGPVLVTGAAGGVGSRPSRCCWAPAIRSRR